MDNKSDWSRFEPISCATKELAFFYIPLFYSLLVPSQVVYPTVRALPRNCMFHVSWNHVGVTCGKTQVT